jgi:hypothetical protein
VAIWLHVDDLLATGPVAAVASQALDDIADVFELVRNDNATWMLGMQIERNRADRTLKLHQASYADQVLQRFNMAHCKPISTPADPQCVLVKRTEQEEESTAPLLAAIGSLRYLADQTRPDLSYSLGTVAKFASSPGAAHWAAVKRILRYLQGTTGVGLQYGGPSASLVLEGFCDSDFAADPADRRSLSGHVMMLGGGAISWMSKKQKGTTALSTAEAEYLAVGAAVQEIIWLRRLLADLCEVQPGPTVLHVDNQAAIQISNSSSIGHNRQKHIDIKHHFVKDVIADGVVTLQYVDTRNNLADPFTKGLTTEPFKRLTSVFLSD